MTEKEWAEKAEKIEQEIKKTFAKEIKRIINDESNVYNEFSDMCYYAAENAMPFDSVFTEETLRLYAQGLESIITEG